MCVLFCCCWCTQASNLYIYICAFVHAFSGLYDIVLGGLFAENKVFSCSPKDWKVLVLCACMLHACLLWFSVFSCSPPFLEVWLIIRLVWMYVCVNTHTHTHACSHTHTFELKKWITHTHTHTFELKKWLFCFFNLLSVLMCPRS